MVRMAATRAPLRPFAITCFTTWGADPALAMLEFVCHGRSGVGKTVVPARRPPASLGRRRTGVGDHAAVAIGRGQSPNEIGTFSPPGSSDFEWWAEVHLALTLATQPSVWNELDLLLAANPQTWRDAMGGAVAFRPVHSDDGEGEGEDPRSDPDSSDPVPVNGDAAAAPTRPAVGHSMDAEPAEASPPPALDVTPAGSKFVVNVVARSTERRR